MPAGGGAPVGIGAEELDVELVQPAGGADVDGVVLELADGGDAGEGKEEAEVIGQVGQEVRDGLLRAGCVFGFEESAVGGEEELGASRGRLGAGAEAVEGLASLAGMAGGEVNVVDEEDRATSRSGRHVRLVEVALAETLERGLLLVEGGKDWNGKSDAS